MQLRRETKRQDYGFRTFSDTHVTTAKSSLNRFLQILKNVYFPSVV